MISCKPDQYEVSIVVPIFNEYENIPLIYQRIASVLSGLTSSAEIIFIDDGSKDDSVKAVKALSSSENIDIHLLVLSRNFGKDIALTAGLAKSKGSCVIPIDADLQHPPELLPQLIELWRAGHKVVLPIRQTRDTDSPLRKILANFFYRTINKISKVEIIPGVGDFRLMDKEVVDVINTMPERSRFMKGLFSWPGYEYVMVEYEVQERESGSSNWSYWKLWNFALDGIFSYSTVPLRVWSYIGGAIVLLSFIYMSVIVFQTLILGINVPGYASTLVSIIFLGGINLTGIGILGEYIGRIFDEVKGRPLYIVKEEETFCINNDIGHLINDDGQ